MKYIRSLFKGEAQTLVHFHKWATILWFAASLPICIFLASSVPFLVFISVYAVVVSHWSTWQSSKVEVKQIEDADVREVLEEVRKKEG